MAHEACLIRAYFPTIEIEVDLKEIMTLLAVLGTGGFLGSWANELRRSRREDRFRWHTERRAACGRFLSAIDGWRATELELAKYIGELRGVTGWTDMPLFDEEYLYREAEQKGDQWAEYAVPKARSLRALANEQRDEVNASLTAIEMVSDRAVVDVASRVRQEVGSLIGVADGFPPRECGGWSEALVKADERLGIARELFVTAAREELGVTR